MANRYLVATGNWNDTAVWSTTSGGAGGASVPGSSDVVYLNNNHTITLTTNSECYSLSHTNGAFYTNGYVFTTNSLQSTGSSNRTLNFDSSTINISGNLMDINAGLGLFGSNLTFDAGTSQINIGQDMVLYLALLINHFIM